MTTRLRSIDPLQLGIVLGVIYAIFGLLAGVIFATFGSAMYALAPRSLGFGGFGVFSIVLFPIGYFVAGFIGGIITAAIYNLVAGWTGGIKLRFDPSE